MPNKRKRKSTLDSDLDRARSVSNKGVGTLYSGLTKGFKEAHTSITRLDKKARPRKR